jgi:hypothetical protein
MQQNGRIQIKSPDTKSLFKMYDKIPANQCVTLRNPTEGLWDDTDLSRVFFSKENIQILQNGIRAGVYNISKHQYLIGEQDCDSLKIIMRSVYLQYAANLPTNITEQVENLNKMVFDFCIPQVYSEAQGYMKFINDASTLVVPIAHPIMSNTSDKTLEFKKWFSDN